MPVRTIRIPPKSRKSGTVSRWARTKGDRLVPQPIRYYGTGKRKDAVARVWISAGTGSVTVNDRPADKYLGRLVLQRLVQQPFEVTETAGRFDVIARCKGGGISGQAGAIRHGISKALLEADPNLR